MVASDTATATIQATLPDIAASFQKNDNPFHEGEVYLQQYYGVQDHVMSYAPRVIRPYMPQQHQDFYQHQPFLVAAAHDKQGQIWSTLLFTSNNTTNTTTTDTTLDFPGGPVPGDALYNQLQEGSDIGLLGIEFATKRRNRVNGIIVKNDDSSALNIQITQSFGNCPQYIQPRQWWWYSNKKKNNKPLRSTQLSLSQMEWIRQADTAFVATGYRQTDTAKDVRFGNDASHRGGPPGFLIVQDSQTVILPDFSGNNHFNTLGNLMLDSRMGLTIPSLETGGLLQLSGHAKLVLESQQAAKTYPGARRLIVLTIESVNELSAGSLPLRWSSKQQQWPLRVTSIVPESDNIKSFYLQSEKEPLPSFQAGQHLPIQLETPDGIVSRTYSLSGSPNDSHYRISIKREPIGKASNYLHDSITVGDTILAQPPAGDFGLNDEMTKNNRRPLVLLSAGVGVTPILSILHQLVSSSNNQEIVWIHGARNGAHHAFQPEVQELARQAGDRLTSRIVYSQPQENDNYDVAGRINLELVQQLVSDWEQAEFYMCGPSGLMAELEEGLIQNGVDSNYIHFETF